VEALANLWKRCAVEVPDDCKSLLKEAFEKETHPAAKAQLELMLENVEKAKELNLPVCQSPGSLIAYVRYGMASNINLDIYRAIVEGARRAAAEGFIRPSIVHPLTRENTQDGTGEYMPVIDVDLVPDFKGIEITVLLKGFGAENASDLVMLLPAEIGDRAEGIKKFVVDTMLRSRGMPCPPNAIGIGIGGTIDCAARLSRIALMRPWDEPNRSPVYAKLEKELLEAINELGIGTMGQGGDITALTVKIEAAFTHVVGLAVACNIQCWCNRRATLLITPDGKVEYKPKPTLPTPESWRPAYKWPIKEEWEG